MAKSPRKKNVFLYEQTRQRILQHIRELGLQPGGMLPSEAALCDATRVSMRTVRRALADLAESGVLVRQQGRGTFVKSLKASEGPRPALRLLLSDIQYIYRQTLSIEIRRIEQVALELGYNLHLHCVGHRVGEPTRQAPDLRDLVPLGQTQACLVISPLRSEDIQTLQQERVPFVTLHQYEDCEATSVAVDFAEVARIGMRHLISLGHRRIGVIGGPLPRPDQNVVRGSDIFVRACRQIMAECGLTVRNELIEQSNYLEQDAARITERWLSMPDRPTAIFAVDDLLAKGAYNTIRGHALRIPADVAVLGCNDSLNSTVLSSVHTPMEQLGEALVRTVHALATTGKPPEPPIAVPHSRLIVRSSTQPVEEIVSL